MTPYSRLARVLPALVIAALLASGRPASPVPVARYSWDDCDPVVTNQNWGGPGTYVQVFSAVGLMPGITEVRFGVDTGGPTDAWSFSDATPLYACQPASRLAFSSARTSCAAAPVTGFQYQRQIWLTRPDKGGFGLGIALDPNFAPDPAVRYTLARLAFDHANSIVGPTAADHCGSAEIPQCFAVAGAAYVTGLGTTALALDSDYLTWQDFNANLDPGARPCPAAVPARAATWGAIKGQYR